MTSMTFVLLIGGLIVLVAGAEGLVRGASRLAAALGISPLVIGLTIVAFGTSSPEFAVSAQSALAGQADIAVGNVIGSNIFNVLFILGISALIVPLVVDQQLVRLDVPLMIGAAALAWVLALDGRLGRLDGGLLFAGILAYTVFQIVQSRRETSAAVAAEYEAEYGDHEAHTPQRILVNVAFAVGGFVLLVAGANWFVDGAIQLARYLGMSELVIGLTIVAAGTSMPEVATSIVAALRGERDIAVGNVVGSNIFNILAVLGFTGLVAPEPGIAVAPGTLAVDLPFMIAVCAACLPIFFTGHTIARWEGVVFLAYYAAYTVYLFLTATNHAALPQFTTAMYLFVVPLTALTLVVSVAAELRARRAAA